MHVEFILVILVLVVAILVAADFFRRTSDGSQEHTESPAPDAGRESSSAPRAGSAPSLSPFEPGRAALPAEGRPYLDTAEAPRAAPRGDGRNWLVRARLSLLGLVSAAAAALATASVLHAVGALQGDSFRSGVSSMREGAIASAVLALVFASVVLAVGLWSATVLIRSVLRPLHQLRAGAVDLAEVWLPDALRHITQVGGEGRPPAARSVGVSTDDEIGDVARAVDQVQGEVLRLANDEAGLRGQLSELFAELSARGQALMDRQIRLIGDLEHGERDADRLASLVTASDLATRMRRCSQNLLVLAGRELPGRWHQPVMLVDVIRVGVSQIGEHERVGVRAQPGIAVSGPAANDVAHVVAELAENATSLSTPDSPVDISGRALATGGVLVEVTDQGVGMNPQTMARANWRLDNPPPVDAAVSRNMGLFVVGRLAARHGIKVRLQPASAGGLTALVWLPDAIVVLPDAGASADLGAEREALARSVRPAPTPADVMTRQPPPRNLAAAPGQPPRHARAAGPQRSGLRLRPIHSPARRQSAGGGAAPDHPALAGDDAGSPGAGAGEPPPAGLPATATAEPLPADHAGGVSVPAASPMEDPADERRLPIYEAVESDWFGNRRTRSGNAASGAAASGDATSGDAASGGTAAAGGGWGSSDRGWDAARTVLAPSSSGVTTAGLPVRVPRANLVPGTIGGLPSDPPAPARSAAATRDRLAGFQRGASQGRAAVNRDGRDSRDEAS
jgi:signal transduction histidine kinase